MYKYFGILKRRPTYSSSKWLSHWTTNQKFVSLNPRKDKQDKCNKCNKIRMSVKCLKCNVI